MNDTQLEKIQTLTKENELAVRNLRQREKNGILPPIMIKYDENQGFYAEAACDLPPLFVVCEYFGEVRTLRSVLYDQNDSIMELLATDNADT